MGYMKRVALAPLRASKFQPTAKEGGLAYITFSSAHSGIIAQFVWTRGKLRYTGKKEKVYGHWTEVDTGEWERAVSKLELQCRTHESDKKPKERPRADVHG